MPQANDRRASWQSASPFLDTALDLPPEERAAWLATIRAQTPALADEIERWLAKCEALDTDAFLDGAAAIESTRTALSGLQLGAYRLIEPLGHGGMGTVWLAERTDGRFEGRVAVKLLSAALVGRTGEDRFAREGRILARLAHPQIAHLIDAGVTAIGQPYLVLEYVEGEPIDAHCDRLRLAVDARVRVFLDVLAPVAHAHANLVVHRDLKPSNVFVTPAGAVKLLDFGIARLMSPQDGLPGTAPLTRDADALLTPAYAAPEQVARGDISTATDVYALGVLLHVLLTGRHPAEASLDQPAALLRAILQVDPPRMSESVGAAGPGGPAAALAEARGTTTGRLREALGGDLDTIVGKALKKAAAERYESVAALAEDLRRYLHHEPIAARRDSTAYRVRKFTRRNRVAVALGAAGVAAVIAGIAGTWTQATRAAVERDFALRQLARAESVNDMNSFLLSDAAPMGRPFTAGDLLKRAEQLLDRHPVDVPDENLVDSLISLGTEYQHQDEDNSSRRVLTRAYELSRALPPSSASTRAKAACALATGLARGDDLPRAQQLVREGLAEMPTGPSFALDRVFCERQASAVAREAGDANADLAHVLEADRLLRASGLGSELAKLSMAGAVAEAYRNAGRDAEAGRAFEAEFAQMTAMGRDQTEQAGTLLNNWALTYSALGRPQQAERLFRRAVEIGSADASGASVSPMLLLNLAREVLELGRLREAIDLLERAAAEATRLGDAVVHQQALLVRIRAWREAGDLARVEALLLEFERTQPQRLAAGHVAFAAFESERGLLAQARGDFAAARLAADRAVAIAEASSLRTNMLTRMLVRRATLALAQDRVAAANDDADRAVGVERARTEPGVPSSFMGRAYFAVARARHAAGRDAEAHEAVGHALENLEPALGADHRDTRSARDLLASLK